MSCNPEIFEDVPLFAMLDHDERAVLAPMPADEKLLRTFATTGVTAGMHLAEMRRDETTGKLFDVADVWAAAAERDDVGEACGLFCHR